MIACLLESWIAYILFSLYGGGASDRSFVASTSDSVSSRGDSFDSVSSGGESFESASSISGGGSISSDFGLGPLFRCPS